MGILMSSGTRNARGHLRKIDALNLNSFLSEDLKKVANAVDSSSTPDAILSKIGVKASGNVTGFVETLFEQGKCVEQLSKFLEAIKSQSKSLGTKNGGLFYKMIYKQVYKELLLVLKNAKERKTDNLEFSNDTLKKLRVPVKAFLMARKDKDIDDEELKDEKYKDKKGNQAEYKAVRRKHKLSIWEKLQSGRLSNKLKVFVALVLWKYIKKLIEDNKEKHSQQPEIEKTEISDKKHSEASYSPKNDVGVTSSPSSSGAKDDKSGLSIIIPKGLVGKEGLWKALFGASKMGFPLSCGGTTYVVPYLYSGTSNKRKFDDYNYNYSIDELKELYEVFKDWEKYRDFSNWQEVKFDDVNHDSGYNKTPTLVEYANSLGQCATDIEKYLKKQGVDIAGNSEGSGLSIMIPKGLSGKEKLWEKLFGKSRTGFALSNGFAVPYLYSPGRSVTKFHGSPYSYSKEELKELYEIFKDWKKYENKSNWQNVKFDNVNCEEGYNPAPSLSHYAGWIGQCAKDINDYLAKIPKAAHGPGVDPKKAAPKIDTAEVEERSKKAQSTAVFLKSKSLDLQSDNFKDKMGKQLEQLYDKDKGTLTDEAKKSVADLPEPTAEASVKDTKTEDLPKSDKLAWSKNEKFRVLANKCVCSCQEVFGSKYLAGQATLKITEEKFKGCGFKLYQINQAASQFNGLESVGSHHSPLYEQGGDKTQGPTVCSQSLTSWVKREQMYEDGTLPDSAAALLDALEAKGVIELSEDKTYYIPAVSYRRYHHGEEFYRNGYLRPSVLNGDGKKEFAKVMAANPVAYMSQSAVSDDELGEGQDDGKKPFTLAFGAALSYQDESDSYDSSNESYALNYMNVYPQYENILKDAKRISKNLGNGHLVVVHLAAIGQGAFGNPKGIHHVALLTAAKKLGLSSPDASKYNLRVIYHWIPKAGGNRWEDEYYPPFRKTTAEVVTAINAGFKELGISGWSVKL